MVSWTCRSYAGQTKQALTLNLEIILRGLSTRSSLSALSMLMWLFGAAVDMMEVMTTTASSWFQGLRRYALGWAKSPSATICTPPPYAI